MKSFALPRLCQDSFKSWIVHVLLLATETGLWPVLDSEMAVEPIDQLSRDRAQLLLLSSLGPEDTILTNSCADPRASLVALKAKYQTIERDAAFLALTQLRSPTLLPGSAAVTFQHLDLLRSKVVAAMPEQVHVWDDQTLLSTLLDLLPAESFGHLRSLVDGDTPDKSIVLRAIVRTETRLEAAAKTAAGAAATRANGRPARRRGPAKEKGDLFCAYCRREQPHH